MTVLIAAGSVAAGALAAESRPAGSAPFVNTADALQRSQYSSRAGAFPRPQLHRDFDAAVPLAGMSFDAGLLLHDAYGHVRIHAERRIADAKTGPCAERAGPRLHRSHCLFQRSG